MEKWDIKSKNIEEFLSKYGKAFDTLDKKAVFLVGILAKFLLDKQYAERKSTPFTSKFHGLKLDVIKIKKLFNEIIEKLREYRVGYPWLEELIAKYLVEADNKGWNLSRDEISYYFTLGLNLGGIFKLKESKNNTEE